MTKSLERQSRQKSREKAGRKSHEAVEAIKQQKLRVGKNQEIASRRVENASNKSEIGCD